MKNYHCLFSPGTEKAGCHGRTWVTLHTWCFYDMASSDVTKVRWGVALSTSLIILTFLRPLLKWRHHREASSVKAIELNNNPSRCTRTSHPLPSSFFLPTPSSSDIPHNISLFIFLMFYEGIRFLVFWVLFVCFCSRFPIWLMKNVKSKDVFIFTNF